MKKADKTNTLVQDGVWGEREQAPSDSTELHAKEVLGVKDLLLDSLVYLLLLPEKVFICPLADRPSLCYRFEAVCTAGTSARNICSSE